MSDIFYPLPGNYVAQLASQSLAKSDAGEEQLINLLERLPEPMAYMINTGDVDAMLTRSINGSGEWVSVKKGSYNSSRKTIIITRAISQFATGEYADSKCFSDSGFLYLDFSRVSPSMLQRLVTNSTTSINNSLSQSQIEIIKSLVANLNAERVILLNEILSILSQPGKKDKLVNLLNIS